MSTAVATELSERVRDLLGRRGEELAALEELPPGGNSRLWKALTAAGRTYLVKRYAATPGDRRDRLGTEFAALCFLRGRGVRCVPEPVLADAVERLGIYSYVTGAAIRRGAVTPEDVERAADFLVTLGAIAGDPAAATLPDASESVRCPAGYEPVIARRINALGVVEGPAAGELAAFAHQELRPFADEVFSLARTAAGRRGIPWDEELPRSLCTLSPSDFGFHNILRTPEGELVFLDFEYFGWDDPAKAAADFFHQPAVPVPALLREPFFRRLDRGLAADPGRGDRLGIYYPLAGVNWCLIMLNPFLRGAGDAPGGEGLRRERLAAARAKLAALREECRAGIFPAPGRDA